MRSRAPLLAIALVAGSFAVPHLAHASIPFFGPIIPASNPTCPAGWGLMMPVINNIIEFLITVVIVLVAPVTIAYAGFLLVVNQGNAGRIEKAKDIFLNLVVGIVIALSAWLIIDAIMAVLYQPSDSSWGTTWSSIVNSSNASQCLTVAAALNQAGPTTGANSSVAVTSTSGALSANQCSTPACTPQALQAAGFSSTQANVMSCIAVTENSGSPSGCNGNACGTFQIMLTVNKLVGPDCSSSGTLNCPALCVGANGAAAQSAACAPCVTAAQNPACNAETAYYIATHVPSAYAGNAYWAWTPPSSDNQQSSACVAQYGGS